jgi:glycosyltransferase involved in cell wall biosynthesis
MPDSDPSHDPPIAFISSSSEQGGAEALMLSIIDGLDRSTVERVIFLGEGPVVDEVRRRSIPVTVVPAARRAGLLTAARCVRRAIRRDKGEIVHANGSRAAIVAVLAALGTRRSVVWLKVDSSRDGPIARILGRRCARIVGISNAVNETFRGRTRRRLRVVYPGIPAREVHRDRSRNLVIRTLGCPSDAEVVVIAARLTPNKGQLDLIEAAPALLEARPGIHVALLGGELWPWEGFEAVLKRRARELGVADSVSFLGHRPPGIDGIDDVVGFVAGCDVLAAPSRYEPESGWKEGFGYSPLEAMSVQVPVVAYRHGSFPEVLGDCALLTEEGNPAALAEGLLRVLGDPGLADRLRDCGIARAARYTPEKAVAGMKAVYRELG